CPSPRGSLTPTPHRLAGARPFGVPCRLGWGMRAASRTTMRDSDPTIESLRQLAEQARVAAAELPAASAISHETIRRSLANIERLDRLMAWANTHHCGGRPARCGHPVAEPPRAH